MRVSTTSEQSTTDTAEELLSQLVQENTQMVDELDSTGSTAPPAARRGKAKKGERAMVGQFLIRDLLLRHELYPRVVHLYYSCKKLSCGGQEVKVLESEEKAYLQSIDELYAAEMKKRSAPQVPHALKARLDLFMRKRVETMEHLKVELEDCKRSLTKAGELIDQSLSDILSRASVMTDLTPAEEVGARAASGSKLPTDPDESVIHTPQSVEPPKRKAAANPSERMKAELMKKRKKGKLPTHATETMKAWWEANREWPYPSETDKQRLLDETGLDVNQLNNWFINQRKRHWNPQVKGT